MVDEKLQFDELIKDLRNGHLNLQAVDTCVLLISWVHVLMGNDPCVGVVQFVDEVQLWNLQIWMVCTGLIPTKMIVAPKTLVFCFGFRICFCI